MYSLLRFLFLLIAIAASASLTYAQGFSHKESYLTIPFLHSVNLSTVQELPSVVKGHDEIPEPGGIKNEIKTTLAKLRAERGLSNATPMESNVPVLDRNFKANSPNGTPNDNSMAISNAGFVVSVVNTNIRIYDTTGKQLVSKTLALFANSLGSLQRTFDPRAIYDPIADRFIVVFLNGTVHTNNNAIVCFSKTNDPTGEWNCYKVPGNPLPNDTTWSDYPIVAITKDELFMTFNLLKDNTDWRDGFTRSIIWQIPLSNGYSGAELATKLYSDITFNDRFLWSICPVHAGDEIQGPNLYFLSVRPDAAQNDTVFLHEVTNTIASGTATLVQKVLKTNVKYGVPPNADQPRFRDTIGNYLQTNDARVLDATVRGNTIYYAGNTVDMENLRAGVYIGSIVNPSDVQPQIRGRIYSDPGLDFGYPSIVALPQGAVFTFSHAASNVFPGTSAAYMLSMDDYIDRIVVKEGTTYINVQGALKDTVERWGDYTGIQVRYNQPSTIWLSGSYGEKTGLTNNHVTWVGEVRLATSSVKDNPKLELGRSLTYPNPSAGLVHLNVKRKNIQTISFTTASGVLQQLVPNMTPAGISIDLTDQPNGMYHITVRYTDGETDTQKIVLNR